MVMVVNSSWSWWKTTESYVRGIKFFPFRIIVFIWSIASGFRLGKELRSPAATKPHPIPKAFLAGNLYSQESAQKISCKD